MKLTFLLLSTLLAGSWAYSSTSRQQPVCGIRQDMVKSLLRGYRETQRAIGIANPTTVVEVLTSKSGSWTILLTSSSGESCIVSAGEAWEETPPPQAITFL